MREKLSQDALTVFRNATKVAALRAQTVASELHINIAGIEVGTDISIAVKSVEDQPKNISTPPVTRIQLEWEAAKMPRLFPFMKAELSIYPLTSTETQLDLLGSYEPPFWHFLKFLELAVAFQRIPPKSQYDSSKLHSRHFINQRRESASIDFAHESGKIDMKNLCIQLIF